jgi:hypothetical protein
MGKVVLFLASLAFLSGSANAETVKIAINSCCVTEDATVKVILRPEDITMGPVDECGEGRAPVRVRSARFLGTHLRVEAETAEGYLLVALLLRSHPMSEALGAGNAVSVRAVRGNVLPDPLGKREPEYSL